MGKIDTVGLRVGIDPGGSVRGSRRDKEPGTIFGGDGYPLPMDESEVGRLDF